MSALKMVVFVELTLSVGSQVLIPDPLHRWELEQRPVGSLPAGELEKYRPEYIRRRECGATTSHGLTGKRLRIAVNCSHLPLGLSFSLSLSLVRALSLSLS